MWQFAIGNTFSKNEKKNTVSFQRLIESHKTKHAYHCNEMKRLKYIDINMEIEKE